MIKVTLIQRIQANSIGVFRQSFAAWTNGGTHPTMPIIIDDDTPATSHSAECSCSCGFDFSPVWPFVFVFLRRHSLNAI